MKEIVLAIFQLCVVETFPNQEVIKKLTPEQQQVLGRYANWKCRRQVQATACQKYYEQYKKAAKECQQI